MATQPVLELHGVRKTYGELVAVDLLDLEVRPGECVVLIGHNGSGKTTTLRLVAGLLEPSEGRVTVAGGDLAQERSRAALSFVPDTPLLYPDLTVREHLELVGLAHGVGDGLDGRIVDLLELFDLTARGDFLPGQLSRARDAAEGPARLRAGAALPGDPARRAGGRPGPAVPAGAAPDPAGSQAGRGSDPALHPPAWLRRRARRPRGRAPRGPHGRAGRLRAGGRRSRGRPPRASVSQASAATLAFVRRHRRAHRSPQQRSDRSTGLYTVGLYTAIGAWIGFQALRQSPARGGSSVWLAGGGLA